MATVSWDRVFRTCIKQEMNAMFFAGSGIFLRSTGGLRRFQMPPLSSNDTAGMIEEILPSSSEQSPIAGSICFDIPYRDKYKFRIVVTGQPSSTAAFLTRIALEAPPLTVEEKKWEPAGSPLSLRRLLGNCIHGKMRDIVLIPGEPPLAWSMWGIHAFMVPKLSDAETIALLAEARVLSPVIEQADGYRDYMVAFDTDNVFRVAAFGYPSPQLAILMKLPRRQGS